MARVGWTARTRSLGRKLVRVLVAGGCVGLLAAASGIAWEAGQRRTFERAGHRPPGRLVDVGGRRLHLLCAGIGEPGVMLVSGMGGSFAAWDVPFRDSIARFTRVCAYDRAGIGWSDPANTPRTADAGTRDLAALLDAARPFDTPPILVGHSIGGLYAHRYATTYPGRVAGLVLVDPTTEQLYETAADWRSDLVYRVLWPALGRLGIVRFRFLRTWSELEADSLARLAGVTSGYSAARATAREYAGLEASFRVGEGRSPDASLTVPVVVLSARRPDDAADGGSRERRRDARRASHARLAAGSPAGRMIELISGHYIFRDRPDTVVAVIRSLVEPSRP